MFKKCLVLFVLILPAIVFAKNPVPENTPDPESEPAEAQVAPDTQAVPESKAPPEVKKEPDSVWSGEAELGYLNTRGDTDSESLYAKAKLVNEGKYWKHKTTYESTQKSENEIATAKRWYATEKSDYKLTDKSYLFLAFTYENDYFSGFEYQATEAIGYGYHIIKQEDLMFDAEVGVGARQTRTDLGVYNSERITKGALNLEWKVSKTATFTQDLSVEAGKDSTISRSETALKMSIVGNLSAKLSHRVKHSSDVPPGKKTTNNESVITLVYSF